MEAAKEQAACVAIKPTIGRKVWFYTNGQVIQDFIARVGVYPITYDDQAIDATVIFVWEDGLVNLDCTDHAGNRFVVSGVPLVQDGEDVPGTPYCSWMPFQIGQAKKS